MWDVDRPASFGFAPGHAPVLGNREDMVRVPEGRHKRLNERVVPSLRDSGFLIIFPSSYVLGCLYAAPAELVSVDSCIIVSGRLPYFLPFQLTL